jgi:tRNA threonylcarbamoyladenosine biosynthesis protein TsaB
VLILSLDTTTAAGSAAVLRGGALLSEIAGDAGLTHGQRLPADLQRVLGVAGVGIDEIELFAVAAGPGSFTGLRVGIATIQGLAFARDRRVFAASALDALARAAVPDAPASPSDRAVGVWMDAQRGEVFAQLFAADGRTSRAPAQSATPERVLDSWRDAAAGAAVTFIGDGAVRYRDAIAASAGPSARIVEPPPLAAIVGRMAAADPGRAVRPHAVMPIYIRKPDAELARDRRADSH